MLCVLVKHLMSLLAALGIGDVCSVLPELYHS